MRYTLSVQTLCGLNPFTCWLSTLIQIIYDHAKRCHICNVYVFQLTTVLPAYYSMPLNTVYCNETMKVRYLVTPLQIQ